jgi:hypothetical protein
LYKQKLFSPSLGQNSIPLGAASLTVSEGFAVPGNSRSPEEGRAYRARFQQKATHGAREQGPSECCGRGLPAGRQGFDLRLFCSPSLTKGLGAPSLAPIGIGTSVRRVRIPLSSQPQRNNPDYRAYSLWSVAGEGFEPPIFWLCVPTTVFTAII